MAQAGYDALVFDQGSMASTDTIYSDRFSMRKGSLFSLHFAWTGTPTGTLTLWHSNKPDPDPDSVTDWIENTDVTFTNPAGGASGEFHNIGNSAAKFYMVRYVNASGTGNIDCWLHAGKGA